MEKHLKTNTTTKNIKKQHKKTSTNILKDYKYIKVADTC